MTEQQLLAMFTALSNPIRLRLLAIIAAEKYLPVYELARLTFSSQQNVSGHLKELERSGLIDTQQSGKYKIHTIRVENLKFLANFILLGKVDPETFKSYMQEKLDEAQRSSSSHT
jgi:DNA-binding transcriptional ArsR family regulator